VGEPLGMNSNPLLIDVPTELRTERLVLRVPRPGDGATVYRAVAQSLERLRPWMPWAQPEPTLEASEAYARQAAAQFLLRSVLDYHGYLAAAPERFVLAGGLHTIDWSVPRFEIGYWVATPFEGQGYVREAVAAFTHLAFDTLDAERVEIRCDADNERSASVARACGYVQEARLCAHERRPGGSLRDTLVFARVRTSVQGAGR
jgi:ribosomal-protein-serine acetyltransferase